MEIQRRQDAALLKDLKSTHIILNVGRLCIVQRDVRLVKNKEMSWLEKISGRKQFHAIRKP